MDLEPLHPTFDAAIDASLRAPNALPLASQSRPFTAEDVEAFSDDLLWDED
jgi:hypothetical protein